MALSATYEKMMDELFRHLEPHELPKIVHTRLRLVLENPVKLFCLVGDADAAFGAPRIQPGLYASNRLVELVEAARALDWKQVAILLEQAITPVISSSTQTQSVR